MATSIDPKLTRPAVVDNRKVTALKEDDGVAALTGVRWFKIGNFYTLDDLRKHLSTMVAGNCVDEALVRGDDGNVYLVYADDLPRAFKEGARFTSVEISGKIERVAREIDWQDVTTRAKGHGTAAVIAVAGAAAWECPVIFAAFSSMAFFVSSATEASIYEKDRDLSGLDVLRQNKRVPFNDPKNTLAPEKKTK